MKDKSPCNGCVPPERYPGCHSHCEKGQAYAKKQDDKRNRINSERRKDKTFDSFKSERVYETKKKAGMR